MMENQKLPVSQLSPIDAEFLWRLYLSERDYQRHHESQRMMASNILAAIASGLIIAVGSGEINKEIGLLLSILLTCIGLFGYLFCAKLYSLIKRHGERSYAYLQALDEIVKTVDIQSIKTDAETRHSAQFEFMREVKLSRIWKSFHIVILISGLFLTAFSISNLMGGSLSDFIGGIEWTQKILQ